MRKYTRHKFGGTFQPRPLPPPKNPLLDAFRSFDGTEIVRSQRPADERVIHELNGVRLTRYWRTTAYDKGFTYELEWQGRFWAGRSAQEVLDKARIEFVKKAPKHVGEIIAIRGWHLQGEYLRSVSSRAVWEGPIIHADITPDVTDYNNKTSGIYAVKMAQLYHLVRSYEPQAYGMVGLYGRVVEHEKGYRAQHAIVRRIILRVKASDAYCKLLADRYDCDVMVEKKFRDG